jgi:hypothetical protein
LALLNQPVTADNRSQILEARKQLRRHNKLVRNHNIIPGAVVQKMLGYSNSLRNYGTKAKMKSRDRIIWRTQNLGDIFGTRHAGGHTQDGVIGNKFNERWKSFCKLHTTYQACPSGCKWVRKKFKDGGGSGETNDGGTCYKQNYSPKLHVNARKNGDDKKRTSHAYVETDPLDLRAIIRRRYNYKRKVCNSVDAQQLETTRLKNCLLAGCRTDGVRCKPPRMSAVHGTPDIIKKWEALTRINHQVFLANRTTRNANQDGMGPSDCNACLLKPRKRSVAERADKDVPVCTVSNKWYNKRNNLTFADIANNLEKCTQLTDADRTDAEKTVKSLDAAALRTYNETPKNMKNLKQLLANKQAGKLLKGTATQTNQLTYEERQMIAAEPWRSWEAVLEWSAGYQTLQDRIAPPAGIAAATGMKAADFDDANVTDEINKQMSSGNKYTRQALQENKDGLKNFVNQVREIFEAHDNAPVLSGAPMSDYTY